MGDPFWYFVALAFGLTGAYVAIRVREHIDETRARKQRLERETQAMWTAHMWRVAQLWRHQLSEYDLMRLQTDRRIIEERMKDGPQSGA